MRRALFVLLAVLFALVAPRAAAASVEPGARSGDARLGSSATTAEYTQRFDRPTARVSSATSPPELRLASDPCLRWKGMWRFRFGTSDVYDARARLWSPDLGAFFSVDEYRYHDRRGTLWGWPRQNPLRWSDPFGRDAQTLQQVVQWAPFVITGGGAVAGVGRGGAAAGLVAAGVFFIGAAAWDTQHQWDEYKHPTVNYGPSPLANEKKDEKQADTKGEAPKKPKARKGHRGELSELEDVQDQLEDIEEAQQECRDRGQPDKISNISKSEQRMRNRLRQIKRSSDLGNDE